MTIRRTAVRQRSLDCRDDEGRSTFRDDQSERLPEGAGWAVYDDGRDGWVVAGNGWSVRSTGLFRSSAAPTSLPIMPRRATRQESLFSVMYLLQLGSDGSVCRKGWSCGELHAVRRCIASPPMRHRARHGKCFTHHPCGTMNAQLFHNSLALRRAIFREPSQS